MKKHLIIAALTVVTILSGCAQKTGSFPTDKKEIMDSFIAGTLDPSYVPAAFFVHFDVCE